MPTFERLAPEDIRVRDRMRDRLDEGAVTRLMESIQRIGLQTPISVRWTPEDVTDYAADLIAGRHRLEAYKRLGQQFVTVAVHDGDDDDARRWEISENLHRADLTALERDNHVAEWIKLTEAKEVSAQPVSKPKGGRPEGGVKAAARELGVNREDARRAVKVSSLSPEAQEIAREAGLDDNRTALLAAAEHKTKEDQIRSLRERAAEKAAKHQRDAEEARKANRETDKIVAERRLDAAKEFLAARLDVTELHTLGEMLAGICDPLSRALLREAA